MGACVFFGLPGGMTMNDGLKKLQKMFAAVALGVLAAVPAAAQQAGAPVNVSRLKLGTPVGIDKGAGDGLAGEHVGLHQNALLGVGDGRQQRRLRVVPGREGDFHTAPRR